MSDLYIEWVCWSNEEGISLILNKPIPMTGTLKSKTWWVSWDKIGEALFGDEYIGKEARDNEK